MASNEMTLNVYVGWTAEGALAYEVCKHSLLSHATIDVKVYPLRHWELRYRKFYERPYMTTAQGQRIDAIDGTPFSTDFSFTRFLVPALEAHASRWALYCDSDMLWLDDAGKLLEQCERNNRTWDVACVKHNWRDDDSVKMHGQKQVNYPCKNWSSLMMMHCRRCSLDEHTVNSKSGAYLHQFQWVRDESSIGSLNPRWNVLHGEQEVDDPAVIHFTRGTPDMPIRSPDDEWSEQWWEIARRLKACS